MKTLILISIFALSALMVSAAYPKPADIFRTDRTDRISKANLDLLANSAVMQRAAVRYLFRKGDANKSGNLDLDELTSVYEILGQFGGVEYREWFVENEFNQGNFIDKNKVISIDEFAFLFNRWFKFMNSNSFIFTAEEDDEEWELKKEIQLIFDQIVPDILFYDFPGIYQEFNTDGNFGIDFDELKSGLQSLRDRFKLSLVADADDYTIRDYYEVMLSPCEKLISESSFRNYMVPLLQKFFAQSRKY